MGNICKCRIGCICSTPHTTFIDCIEVEGGSYPINYKKWNIEETVKNAYEYAETFEEFDQEKIEILQYEGINLEDCFELKQAENNVIIYEDITDFLENIYTEEEMKVADKFLCYITTDERVRFVEQEFGIEYHREMGKFYEVL